MILVIGFASSDLDFEIRNLDLPWEIILIVIVVLVVAFVLVVLRVQQIRNRVLPVLAQARVALSEILLQPSRALGLLGSNLLYWLTLGTTLWLVLTGVGVDIGFGSALVVVLAADLLAGFVPVPGGVGVAEAVMTGFLVALGVDEPAALAATVAYRFITFYLPVIEGFFALKWLERNEYV